MPNYGYRCQSCQSEFETLQRMSDPPQAACPDCGGAGTRLFYPTGILFKGGGFYKTDSRTSSAAAPAAAGTDTAKPSPDGAPGSATPAAPTTESPSPSTSSGSAPPSRAAPTPGGSATPASTKD